VFTPRIGVEVKDGVVTLAGQVDSYSEKWNAQRAAQRVSGVRALAIELKVHLSNDNKRTDAEIAGAAKKTLEWTGQLPKGAIKVMVEAGWVTLTGAVDWQFQRKSAADSVRFLMGVVGVSDQMTIKPSVSAAVVKSDIEAALKRIATAEAKKISVAWATPGVRNVVDRMSVAY
jgi:osmotically-inducible protein OsmY